MIRSHIALGDASATPISRSHLTSFSSSPHELHIHTATPVLHGAYSAAASTHADVLIRRQKCFLGLYTRARGFVSLQDYASTIPFDMRSKSFGVAVRSGSVAERDLSEALLALRPYEGRPQGIRAAILHGFDAGAWRAIVCLIRYGLFDPYCGTDVPLPNGAPPSFPKGNRASLIHALAASGSEPAHGLPGTVSLADRIVDLNDAAVRLNTGDALRRTPMHYAAICNNRPALEALLAAGAKSDCPDGIGDTALLSAIKFGGFDCISSLVKANPAALGRIYRGPETQTDLSIRADVEDEGAVLRLYVDRIKRSPVNHEWSALHWAASLVNDGAQNALVGLLKSMKHHCSNDLARLLVNEQTFAHGATALQIAIRARDSVKIRALLEAGADPNLITKNNRHPMHWAAAWGQPTVMRLLIEAGGDMNHYEVMLASDMVAFQGGFSLYGRLPLTPYSGDAQIDSAVDLVRSSPFDTAVRFGRQDCARVIFGCHGAEATLARLAAVAQEGMIDLLDEMLRSPGANPIHRARIVDHRGRSLLHHAAFSDNPDLIDYLVNTMRLDPDLKDFSGSTPSMLAERLAVWSRLQAYARDYSKWRHDHKGEGGAGARAA